MAIYFQEKGISYYKNNVLLYDPFAELAKSYEKVIEDCKDYPLFVAFLRHKQSMSLHYSDELKYTSEWIRTIGGHTLYEFLCRNLPLPSDSTARGYVAQTSVYVEGSYNIDDLEAYIQKYQLVGIPFVHSEDATRCKKGIQYDKKRNQCVGFSMQYNNGIPIIDSYPCTNPTVVQSYFDNCSKSSYLQAWLLKPLKSNVPPFLFQFFGFDNRFTSNDAQSRHEYGKQLLQSRGIRSFGFATDGDSRYLKLGMMSNKLGCNNSVPGWLMRYFNADINSNDLYFQDMDHISNKGKNRLYNVSEPIIIGNFLVSPSIFEKLIDHIDFKHHGLTRRHLQNKDKMSAKFAHEISSEKVEQSLKMLNDEETCALRLFLKCLRWQFESFSKPDLAPLERIYRMAYVTFMFRTWRFLMKGNLKHFVSSNMYSCIEINFHNLIILSMQMRDENLDRFFLTFLFNSQHCESFFRCLRSWSTNQATRINWDVSECLHVIKQVVCSQNASLALTQKGFIMPNKNKHDNILAIEEIKLPSNVDIEQVLESALKDVYSEMQRYFGSYNIENAMHVNVSTRLNTNATNQRYEDDTEDESDVEVEIDIFDADESESLNENTFLIEQNDSESSSRITKEQFIRRLNMQSNQESLSNDRSRRFIASNERTVTQKVSYETIERSSCIFKNEFILLHNKNIACVIDFRRDVPSTATKSSFSYKNYYAYVNQPLQIFCQFYILNSENCLKINEHAGVQIVHISDYAAHLPTPSYNQGKVIYEPQVAQNIRDHLIAME